MTKAEYNARWKKNHPAEAKEAAGRAQKKWLLALRSEVFVAYGGRCACCGEDWLPFLQLDHIDGDGAEHRRQLGAKFNSRGASVHIFQALKKAGWPREPRLQVLCANCHQAKTRHETCRHQPYTHEEDNPSAKLPQERCLAG